MDECESLATGNGSANTMWCRSRKAGGKCCMGSCGNIWGRCSASWRNRRKAGLRKGNLLPDHVRRRISIPPK
jgi:hypothetical protein